VQPVVMFAALVLPVYTTGCTVLPPSPPPPPPPHETKSAVDTQTHNGRFVVRAWRGF